MIVFACISPHAPIILPNVGSTADRQIVKKTISSLERLGEKMAKIAPDKIIISSPHQTGVLRYHYFFYPKTKVQSWTLF